MTTISPMIIATATIETTTAIIIIVDEFDFEELFFELNVDGCKVVEEGMVGLVDGKGPAVLLDVCEELNAVEEPAVLLDVCDVELEVDFIVVKVDFVVVVVVVGTKNGVNDIVVLRE